MSNTTSTTGPLTSSQPPPPPPPAVTESSSLTSSPPANSPSSTTAGTNPPTGETSTPSTTTTTTSPTTSPTTDPPPPTTSPTTSPTTQPPPTTTPTSTPSSSTSTPTTSPSQPPSTIPTTIVTTPPGGGDPITSITTVTRSSTPQSSDTGSAPNSSGTSAQPNNPSGGSTGGLSESGRIAVAVVVPIAAVALLVLAGLFFWRKRKQRKDAEEQRRKEVEEYGFNPNADATVPNVGPGSSGGPAGAYEMKEDAASGYRGWGSTTLAGSSGRKASTTMSGGGAGVAYSDATSPTRGNVSDTRSGEPLMNDGSVSPEGEILGAMGPSAANNRGGADVRRGPSNASSSYSAAARSDGSGEGGIGMAYSGDPYNYNQYGTSSPYAAELGGNGNGNGGQRPAELNGAGTPVIRDNPARRNTRIENSGHYPQQTAGISANF